MINELLQLDIELFLKINRGMSNSVFDFLLPLLRNRFFWAPLYLFMIIFFIKEYKKEGYYLVMGVLLAFALGDLTASRIIKPNVQRIRPCNESTLSNQMIKRVPCGTGYSYPSAHATNHFAIAIFLIGALYRRWKPVLPIGLTWAIAIAFSQIYVGVHYPFDVVTGATLGTIIGIFVFSIYKKLQQRT